MKNEYEYSTWKLFKLAIKKNPWYYWFTISWWDYLREPKNRYLDESDIHIMCCRAADHPEGVFWYSSGYEPNMHCKGCGDDLG